MSIFSIKAGERANITTQQVDVSIGPAKGMLKTDVTYDATATDEYQDWPDGTRRRKFIDASVDFGLGREIWLANGPNVYRFADGRQITQENWEQEAPNCL